MVYAGYNNLLTLNIWLRVKGCQFDAVCMVFAGHNGLLTVNIQTKLDIKQFASSMLVPFMVVNTLYGS